MAILGDFFLLFVYYLPIKSIGKWCLGGLTIWVYQNSPKLTLMAFLAFLYKQFFLGMRAALRIERLPI